VWPVAGNQTVNVMKYRGTPQTVREMFRIADGERGQKSFALRERVEDIIRYVRPRDYWSEILAVYYWTCGPQFRYTRDPRKVEQVKDPLRILWEIDNYGSTLIDCDEFATFLRASIGSIGGRSRIVTVGFRPTNGKSPNPRLFEDPAFRLMSSPHPRLPGPFTHVFAQAAKGSGGWVTVDPVAGPRTPRMHQRVKQYRIYESND
jgi:hypothetical protein